MLPGTVIHGYTIEKSLSQGGFGLIYVATSKTGEQVVLKQTLLIRRDDADEIRKKTYITELETLERIHASEKRSDVVRLIDYDKNSLILVLEYIPDGDLSEWRVANWALEQVEDNMRLFCTKLLHSILYLHSLGILHRDLKPSNVLLRRSSAWSEKRAKRTLLAFDPVLSDFGTAAAGEADVYSQQFQTYAGTPWFMAPEVKRQTPTKPGTYDAKADVWSLGVLLLMIYVGLKGITASTSLETLMAQNRHTMSDEFAHLLERMLTPESEARMSWDEVAAHAWFKFPEVHAHEWMQSVEALPKCDELMRPASVEPLHIRCDSTLTSPQGAAFFGLLDAKDLALTTQKRLTALHAEWTTNKQRFYTLYMRPWDTKLLTIQNTLAYYQPFRHIATMRTIFSIATSYGPSMARFLMLLEVGRVCMERLKSFDTQSAPSDPTYVRPALQMQWQQLFEEVQRLLLRSNISTDASSSSSEPVDSPVRVFGGSGTDIAFHALMHATCVLKYQEYVSTLHLIINPPHDDGFMPAETSVDTLDNLILKLRELRLVMEYVITVLPIASSLPNSALGPIRSGSASSLPGSVSTVSQSYHSSSTVTMPLASSSLGNEAICQDFVDRITLVIHNLPSDIELL